MSLAAREASYSPYSGFKVGAALLAESGKIYTGCNIENSSYGATNCAERTAFFKAVSDGERGFNAIAVAADSSDGQPFCPPCGMCLQVMNEFCGSDFKIILVKDKETYSVKSLSEFLPYGFSIIDSVK